MLKNNMKGILIAVDGPNGVGKSSIVKLLNDELKRNGYKSVITKEPSYSKIGCFLRKESETLYGNALACLVASDRYNHINKEILPALLDGYIVLCDRYILSSFIFQGMDNVSYEFINGLNSQAVEPDIQIFLSASIDEIQKRLERRKILTRFEKGNKTESEIENSLIGIEYLKKKNIKVYEFNTEIDIEINIQMIYEIIVSYIQKRR